MVNFQALEEEYMHVFIFFLCQVLATESASLALYARFVISNISCYGCVMYGVMWVDA
jgi:hypothetical protein